MVDYSKWDKIEVSDDEDDVHPNIDTGSLFRWRHQARMERMDKQKYEEQLIKDKKIQVQKKLEDLQKELEKAVDKDHVNQKIKAAESEYDAVVQEEANFLKTLNKEPLNFDTISKPGFDSVKIVGYKEEETKEYDLKDLESFTKKNEANIKHFGMLADYADSREYLLKNLFLVCEHTASYLCIWSIDMVVEEKWALFERISHQAVSLQFLLELAKSLKVPREKLVKDFYTNLNKNIPEYMKSFDTEIEAFRGRCKEAAKKRIERAIEEQEKNGEKPYIGPGGLSAQEVFESLPEKLQECFEKRDTELLKVVLSDMDVDEAQYHFRRCIDSGLWCPSKNEDEGIEEEYDDVE